MCCNATIAKKVLLVGDDVDTDPALCAVEVRVDDDRLRRRRRRGGRTRACASLRRHPDGHAPAADGRIERNAAHTGAAERRTEPFRSTANVYTKTAAARGRDERLHSLLPSAADRRSQYCSSGLWRRVPAG
jgi:hypothetical protein